MSIVALLQMCSGLNPGDNLKTVSYWIQRAADKGAQLIILPENFAMMGRGIEDIRLIAETEGSGLIQDTVRELALSKGIWIIAGTIPIRCPDQDRVFAASMVYTDKGEMHDRYDKIHLFDVTIGDKEAHRESDTFSPGDRFVVVDTPVGKIGLSVCYDLRFAELYRALALQGADIFSIPSAFTATTGAAHWKVLLRARAIENLCYVLAPNQGGNHDNGRQTWGHSMAVSPWGKVLIEASDTTGMLFTDIDIQGLQTVRQQFPCVNHHVLS